jgi:hypothetical protein
VLTFVDTVVVAHLKKILAQKMSRHRPDDVEELSRIASTICGGDRWGRGMTAGDYLAAAVLIPLIVWGVKGLLTQDKFKL